MAASNNKALESGDVQSSSPLEEIKERFERLPDEQKTILVSEIVEVSESHQGPVPSPRQMAGYKKIDPSIPDRLVAAFERQAEHRQKLEMTVVKDDFRLKSRGQTFAFSMVVVILAFCAFLAVWGSIAAAATVATSTIVGIAYVFVTGRKMPLEAPIEDAEQK
jgi:uncharacterized membrane protein